MKTIKNAQVMSVSVSKDGIFPIESVSHGHTVNGRRWVCVQENCDGIHHYYMPAAS